MTRFAGTPSRARRAIALSFTAALLAACLPPPAAAPEPDAQMEARRRFSLVRGEVRFDPAPGPEVAAIARPVRLAAGEAGLDGREWVIGVAARDTAVAYPLRTLAAHEVVNDWIDRYPIAVTWSPSSASAAVYVRSIGERRLTIGVSSHLWRGHRVLFDAETRSLWSQLLGECLQGELLAHRLGQLPCSVVRWDDWRRAYPATLVLDPLGAAAVDPFALSSGDSGRVGGEPGPHDLVAGVLVGRTARAYPFEALRRARVVEDRVGSEPVVFFHDAASGAVAAYSRRVSGLEVHFEGSSGDGAIRDVGTRSRWDWMRGTAVEGKMAGVALVRLVATPAYWSAWHATFPETETYVARR